MPQNFAFLVAPCGLPWVIAFCITVKYILCIAMGERLRRMGLKSEGTVAYFVLLT